MPRPNAAFTWVIGGAITMLVMAVGTRWGQRLLHVDAPDLVAVGAAVGWLLAAALGFGAAKQWRPVLGRIKPA